MTTKLNKPKQNIEPTEGMGCTISIGSDSYAYTVIYVSLSKRIIEVQEDTATRIDGNGLSEQQEYTYQPNPLGRKKYYKFYPLHGWREVRNGTRWKLTNGGSYRLHLDVRATYFDPSF